MKHYNFNEQQYRMSLIGNIQAMQEKTSVCKFDFRQLWERTTTPQLEQIRDELIQLTTKTDSNENICSNYQDRQQDRT